MVVDWWGIVLVNFYFRVWVERWIDVFELRGERIVYCDWWNWWVFFVEYCLVCDCVLLCFCYLFCRLGCVSWWGVKCWCVGCFYLFRLVELSGFLLCGRCWFYCWCGKIEDVDGFVKYLVWIEWILFIYKGILFCLYLFN